MDCKHHALLGPFSSPPFVLWCQLYPGMTRPKKSSADKRISIDLGFPPSKSVNACIAKWYYLGTSFNFSLPSVSTFTDRLITIGSGAWLWGGNLVRAYGQLRVCLLSVTLLGISLNNNIIWYYTAIWLPHISARTTRAAVWILRQRGFFYLCYLDDFIGMESTTGKALEAYNEFLNITSRFGLVLVGTDKFPLLLL